jgi:hypothetical protein
MYKRIRLLVSVLIHMKSVFVRELLLITRRQVMSLYHIKKSKTPQKKLHKNAMTKPHKFELNST